MNRQVKGKNEIFAMCVTKYCFPEYVYKSTVKRQRTSQNIWPDKRQDKYLLEDLHYLISVLILPYSLPIVWYWPKGTKTKVWNSIDGPGITSDIDVTNSPFNTFPYFLLAHYLFSTPVSPVFFCFHHLRSQYGILAPKAPLASNTLPSH